MYFMRKRMLRTVLSSGVERHVASDKLTCVLEKYCLHLQGFCECDGMFISNANIYHNIQLHTPQQIATDVGTLSFVLCDVPHTHDIHKN